MLPYSLLLVRQHVNCLVQKCKGKATGCAQDLHFAAGLVPELSSFKDNVSYQVEFLL